MLEWSRNTWFSKVYPTTYLLNENFEFGYSHSIALLQFDLKLEGF